MVKAIATKLIVCFFLLQIHISWSQGNPLQTNLSVEENVPYIEFVPYNDTSVKYEVATDTQNDSFHPDRGDALQKLRQQIIQAKRAQLRIFAHDTEDILFMLSSIILMCFHLFFMDTFIRLTRTRFQAHARFNYLSTVHLFLTFLVCTVYFLLILLHYRDSQYCG